MLVRLWLCLSYALASDAQVLHTSLYEASQRAEEEGRYTQAYAHCEDAIAVWPTGPRAPTCDKRLLWMDQRRDADGRFATLEALQSVRENDGRLTPKQAFKRVSALRASEGQSATMEAEIDLWLARTGLAQGLAPETVLTWTTGAWERRDELPTTTRLDITLTHAKTLALAGRFNDAAAVEEEARVARNATRNTPVEAVAQAQRRATWAKMSGIALGLFLLGAAPSAYREGTQHLRSSLPGLVLIWISVGASWVLATAWEPRAGSSLPLFGAIASFIHVLSRSALRARTATRWPIRLAAGVATVCAGYLSLYQFNNLDWVIP